MPPPHRYGRNHHSDSRGKPAAPVAYVQDRSDLRAGVGQGAALKGGEVVGGQPSGRGLQPAVAGEQLLAQAR